MRPADTIAIALTVAAVVAWLILYARYGVEPPIRPVPHKLPDPPALWTSIQLSRVWTADEGSVTDPIANLLELIRRNAICLVTDVMVLPDPEGERVSGDFRYSVRRLPSPPTDLSPADRYFIDEVLFWGSDAREVSVAHLMIEGARMHTEVFRRLNRWWDLAYQQPLPFPLEDPTSQKASRAAAAIGIALLTSSIGFVIAGSLFTVLTLAAGGILFTLRFLIGRRTPEAAQAIAEWTAYRRFLIEDLVMPDQPPHSVIIWGRHLVYGISLGAADRTVRQFRLLCPDGGGIQSSLWMWS